MAKIFISHSSYNKRFARQLASDLKALGHDIWLDAWHISVGDNIVQEIEKGLSEAEFLIIVLTKKAVESGWVEKEWKAKYWEEVNAQRTIILPVLKESCAIPLLLQTKRYADFRRNYSIGLVMLNGALTSRMSSKEVKGLSEITLGIQKLYDRILKYTPKPDMFIAFDRSSGILVAALAQMMHLPEILVLNRTFTANETTIKIGNGVKIDSNVFNQRKLAIIKFHMLTGETIRQGLLYLKKQEIKQIPPVFALYASKVAINRMPHMEWIYEHPDPEKTLSQFPWNKVNVQMI